MASRFTCEGILRIKDVDDCDFILWKNRRENTGQNTPYMCPSLFIPHEIIQWRFHQTLRKDFGYNYQ